MSNKIVFVTVSKELGKDHPWTNPRVMSIPENEIKNPKPINDGKETILSVTISGDVQPRKLKCYETVSQIEAARNPSTTDPFVSEIVKLDLAAAGTNQGTATDVGANHYLNKITSGTGGVELPAMVAKDAKVFVNATAAAVNLYPNGTETINNGAAGVAYSLAAGARVHLYCETDGEVLIADDWTV